MNTVTIKFGQGTPAWEDMTEIVKFLGKRGYAIEPEEEIGTVKLVKKIKEEPEVRHVSNLKVGDQVMYQDEVETIHSISRDAYGEYDVQIGCYHEKFCQTSEFEVIE
ncbi:hypothetical protein P9Z39_20940 [Bacillus thuringiensis]|uniref:hypothetical protein n=1 Tax=Bacillus thuringiensis TaxID=1428 RepID=UPI000A38BB9C|nr:hypothetical protein [Bacillus thuringiensis]MCU5233892.1 hypothetical protein [Bacillus cereus]MEC2708122.1 hypothetical protein [Bacillus thuringiensis]OUB76431.1 hypothetical protein BK765_01995 [Bacillus thuringiensis serovar dakota]